MVIDSTFKNASILIVDDKQVNIDVLYGFLDLRGYSNIQTTTDSRLAADLFRTCDPDLVLLDLMMPHFSGYEVIEQLKELIPHDEYMPVLVLTADMTAEAKQRALELGAKDFLSKPFDLVEVGLRIDNLLFARYLYKQLRNQNHQLEDKVKERTKELEEMNFELIAARDKAEESDRLKAEFLGMISHEIRTPLNGILGMYQVLTDPNHSWQQKQSFYNGLRQSSDRLIKTITDYMDMSLLYSGSMTMAESEFNPEQLLRELYNFYWNTCEARELDFKFQTDGKADALKIISDPNMLRTVLSQLIDNAIKFTKQGSITVGLEIKKGELQIFVSDTGVGIDEVAHKLVFKHFMQENQSHSRGHEGSGLGLSIADKMTRMLGGKIELKSSKGHGSTFTVILPLNPI